MITPMQTERIWCAVRKASLLRFVSYGRRRLPKRKIAKQLPEVIRLFKTFGPKSLQAWNDKLFNYNALLRRGASMRLCRTFNTARLMHCSLDMYMLQMHSDEIAGALDCFSTFGKRVQCQIEDSPDSEVWWLCSDVSIHRNHWFELCRRVMSIIHLLGLDLMEVCNDKGRPNLSKYPHNFPCGLTVNGQLHSASKAAQDVFGASWNHDYCKPSLLELYTFADERM